jgi:hypothetical protein
MQGNATTQPVLNRNENEFEWKTWYWGDGRFCHFVPLDWKFPTRLTMKALWDLWWFGDKTTGIRPFYRIDFSHELKETKVKMRHSRALAAVEYFIKVAHEKKLFRDGIICVSQLLITESDNLFMEVFSHVIQALYANKKEPGRPMEISYGTIYDKLPKSTSRASKKQKEIIQVTVKRTRTTSNLRKRRK